MVIGGGVDEKQTYVTRLSTRVLHKILEINLR